MAQDIEKVIKLLEEMKKSNSANADNFDRILNNIGSKLNAVDNNTNTELLKAYISELTQSVDEKYSNTLNKFENIETAIKAVYDSQGDFVKNSDMKGLFDVFSKNVNNFYTEARQEKAILAGIETKISDIASNKTDKEDILRTISLLRNDLGNVNLSYKNTIDDINTTLKSVLAGIKSVDPYKTGDTAKAQIDVIYKSISDLITTLESIEEKEQNLERILSNVATNEDLKITKGIIDSIIEKTNEIDAKLNSNAQKDDLDEIHQALEEINMRAEKSAGRDDFIQFQKQAEDILSYTDDIKQTLGKMAQDIEKIPDASQLERGLTQLYSQINDLSQNFVKGGSKGSNAEMSLKIDSFEKELVVIRNIVTDLNDALASKIMSTLETLSNSGSELEKIISRTLKSIPQQADIDKLLKSNKILDEIYDKTTSIENWLIASNIKENSEKIATQIEHTSTSNEVEGKFEQLHDKIEDLQNNMSSIENYIKSNSGADYDFIKSELDEIKSLIISGSSNLTNIDDISNMNAISVKKYLSEVKSMLQDNPKGGLYSKILSIEDSIVNNQTFNESAFSQIISKIDSIKNKDVVTKNEGQMNQAMSEISSLKDQIGNLSEDFAVKDIDGATGYGNNYPSNVEKFISEKLEEIKDNIEEITEISERKIAEGFTYQTELVEQKTAQLQELISDISSNFKTDNPEFSHKLSAADEKLGDFRQELQLVSTDITESISQNASNIIEDLKPIREMLERVYNNLNPHNLRTEVKNLNSSLIEAPELKDLRDNFEDLYGRLTEKFIENENNLKDFILTDTDSIIIKLDNLRDYVEKSLDAVVPPEAEDMKELKIFVKEIKDFKENQEQLFKQSVDDIKKEIKQQGDEIKSMLSVVDNNEEIIKAIEDLKKSFKAKSVKKSQKGEEGYESFVYSEDAVEDLKSDFAKYSKQIEELSDDNRQIKNVLNEISSHLGNISGGTTIQKSISENDIDDDFNVTEDDIFGGDKFDFVQAFDILQSDIKKLSDRVDEVKNSSENKEVSKIPSISNSGLIMSINSKIDELLKSLNGNWLSGVEKYIKTADIAINSKLDSIESKLDVFVSDSTNTDILNEVSETLIDINDSVADITPKIEASDKKLSSMLEELKEEITKIGDGSDSVEELNNIKSLIGEQKTYIEELEPNEKLQAFKKCLDEISFEVNALAADSNADSKKLNKTIKEMKESLMSAVVTIFDQVSFVEETEDIKDFVEERTDEINKNIAQITKQLHQMASSDDSTNYTYTMQDIETDLAKLRLALQDSKQIDLTDITNKLHSITSSVDSLTQDEMKELKTEISNLKEQTEFLIANSDRSYNALNTCIDGFGEIVDDSIIGKVEHLSKMLENSAQSDNMIKQALIYMGEWIDSATSSINKISANSDEITRINEVLNGIEYLKTSVDTQIEKKFEFLNSQIKSLESQFIKVENLETQLVNQQERIDRLEMNIDKLLSIVENLEDPGITRKMDKIEKQLSKLGTNVEKLASYVD